ncbi:MAG: glycosyltransferase family 4 protein [Nitrososphaerota archaeon]|nr:glycosyltransferase family 4 protein [Nitrososphaerota archaeon]
MNKICYLAPDVPIPSPRGSSVHVRELAENLSILGNEVHVICRRESRSQAKEEKMGRFTVHRVNRYILRSGRKYGGEGSANSSNSGVVSKLYYLYLLTIFRVYVSAVASNLIRKYKLDFIIERETSFGAGGLASIFTGKQMILEIIGPRYSRFSAMRSKKILYYTESMLRSWVDRSKCVAVPAGVNLSLFYREETKRVEVRSKLNLDDNFFVMGYVGTFQSWHGIDTLIEAVSLVKDQIPNLRLLLIGPNYETYRSLAEKSSVLDRCVFPGPVNYELVPDYINACDIMVALYEPSKDPIRAKYGIGWPLKILEYMACDKATISTRVDPVTKIITSQELGYLVQPGKPQELSNLIQTIYAERTNLEKIGENGRNLVDRDYSWAKVTEMIANLMQ